MFDSPWFFSPLVNTVWGTTLASSFAALTLSDWDIEGHALSTIPVAALLVVYVALIPRTEDTHFLPRIDIEEAIVPLSLRVVVILAAALGMQTAAFGLPSNGIILTLSLGLAKALSWYFTTQMVCSALPIERN